MEKAYPFDKIEKKWQRYWEKIKLFHADTKGYKNKYYCLMMFPYPSSSLHVGHGRQEIGRLEPRSIDWLQTGPLQDLCAAGRHAIRDQHLHDDCPPKTSSMVRISALIPSTV